MLGFLSEYSVSCIMGTTSDQPLSYVQSLYLKIFCDIILSAVLLCRARKDLGRQTITRITSVGERRFSSRPVFINHKTNVFKKYNSTTSFDIEFATLCLLWDQVQSTFKRTLNLKCQHISKSGNQNL